MESNSMGSNYDDMHSDQLDNLSNLIINNGGGSQVGAGGGSGMGTYGIGNTAEDTDNMLLEQYERDLDKGINDGHISERDQCYQRLFQSFQTSACTVAQMFKDKMSTPGSTSSLSSQQQQPQPQLTSWQSFQSSAGAITLLYKDSLEACKTHYDIGVSVGQQRKLKELITWLKKKRRRTIRKDELISFLVGKQHPPASGSTVSSVGGGGPQASLASMFMMMNPSSNSTSSTTTNNSTTPSQQNNNVFFNGLTKHQQSTQSARGTVNNNSNLSSSLLSANSATCPANLATIGQANDTSSDLATFREALIMHNRSRDGPLPHSHHLQSYVNHQHHHSSHQPPCEDLDCFFCEQIATHAEPHKRSSSFMFGDNNNMESSPTRKRSRFY